MFRKNEAHKQQRMFTVIVQLPESAWGSGSYLYGLIAGRKKKKAPIEGNENSRRLGIHVKKLLLMG